jgi:hypothetical protein
MNTSPGSYVLIWLTGETRTYIAQVVEENPLILKIEENGPGARLRSGDYILLEKETERIQDPEQEQAVLREAAARGFPLISALSSLGVTDGRIREILPVE